MRWVWQTVCGRDGEVLRLESGGEHYVLSKAENEKSCLNQHEVLSGHRMASHPLKDQIALLDQVSWESNRRVLESIHIRLRGEGEATLNHKSQ